MYGSVAAGAADGMPEPIASRYREPRPVPPEVMRMQDGSGPVRELREVVGAMSRFSARGCSSTMCDRVWNTWMTHQLLAIGRAASEMPHDVRAAHPEVPWDRLTGLMDAEGRLVPMTAGEMQQFVERILPSLRKSLTSA